MRDHNYIMTVNGDRRKSPGIKRRKPNTNFFCFCRVQLIGVGGGQGLGFIGVGGADLGVPGVCANV